MQAMVRVPPLDRPATCDDRLPILDALKAALDPEPDVGWADPPEAAPGS